MTIKVHHLRPAPGAKTAKTRVGRGEGSKGKTAGRGTKGTGARKNTPATFEGGQLPLHMRLPKLKGFRTPSGPVPGGQRRPAGRAVPRGRQHRRRRPRRGRLVRDGHLVKVLGDGDVGVKLDVTAHAFSGAAASKLSAAGGSSTTL